MKPYHMEHHHRLLGSGGKRLHGMDTLRAHMMLLGVVFHGALNYTVAPTNPTWPIHDSATSGSLTLLVSTITLFRMPLFFLLAGFFFCLMQERKGLLHALQDRMRRIALPLLFFLPVMFLLCGYGFLWGLKDAIAPVEFEWAQLYHLWFLYFLVFFYALAALGSSAMNLGRPALARATNPRLFGWLLAWITVFSILMWAGVPMDLGASIAFVPNGNALIYYCFFFFLGYWLYRFDILLPLLEKHFWRLLSGSIMVLTASVVWMSHSRKTFIDLNFVEWFFLASAQLGIYFTMVAGYLRWVKAGSSWSRYLSAASYWVYLIHLPVVIWMCNVLAPLDWNVFLKFFLNVAFSLTFCIASYHVFVRNTWLGKFLDGKKLVNEKISSQQKKPYPRPLPAPLNKQIS